MIGEKNIQTGTGHGQFNKWCLLFEHSGARCNQSVPTVALSCSILSEGTFKPYPVNNLSLKSGLVKLFILQIRSVWNILLLLAPYWIFCRRNPALVNRPTSPAASWLIYIFFYDGISLGILTIRWTKLYWKSCWFWVRQRIGIVKTC